MRVFTAGAPSFAFCAKGGSAFRLARYFKTTPQFWMNMQPKYELDVAEDELAAKIERDVRLFQAILSRQKRHAGRGSRTHTRKIPTGF